MQHVQHVDRIHEVVRNVVWVLNVGELRFGCHARKHEEGLQTAEASKLHVGVQAIANLF